MSTATITSKGQVTIPKEIRDRLSLHAGDRVDFTLTEHGEVLLTPLARRVDDLFGRLHKSAQTALSPDAMDAAIRKRLNSGRE